jgi:hypothetical protein
MWVKPFVGRVVLACKFITKINCTNHDLHLSLESEALEVEFVELYEDTQETVEALDLVPIVEGLH